jgi:hypothetical protein
MDFWLAAIIIFTIWAAMQVYTRRHDRELGVTRDEDGNPVFPPKRQDAATKAEVEELRERIVILERIVTDRGYDVASQIEALRELPEAQNGGGVPIDIGRKEHAR